MSYTLEQINEDIKAFEGIEIKVQNITMNTRFNKLYSTWAVFPLKEDSTIVEFEERVRRFVNQHAIHNLRVVK